MEAEHINQIGGLRVFHRKIGRQFAIERGHAFARRPQFPVSTLRVHQRGFDGVAPPQAHCASACPDRSAATLHPPRAAAKWFVLAAGHVVILMVIRLH